MDGYTCHMRGTHLFTITPEGGSAIERPGIWNFLLRAATSAPIP